MQQESDKPDCNAIDMIDKLKNWKELCHVVYQNSVGTATKHEKTVYSK